MPQQHKRHWTPSEISQLRRDYARFGPRPVAAALGRSRPAVLHMARRLGVVSGRLWTPDQIEAVRKNYGRITARDLAKRLGKSASGLHQMAARLDLVRHYARPCDRPDFEALLRSRHAAGWSDQEIAASIGTDRHTIGERRKRLGLAHNGLSERRRRRVADRTREQCRKAGVPSLAALRVKVFRDRARAEGWPDDLRPRAVQILNALWDRGPMTRREIAEAVGMPWLGSRQSLKSNDQEGSYLANLMARGLVVCLGRVCRGVGRGRSVYIYSIPPLTIRRNIS